MAHYFTREEAEALLPEISVLLSEIQKSHSNVQTFNAELEALRIKAAGNGHNLHERITQLQREVATYMQQLQGALDALQLFGCELKDPETGLIDFLSLRDGQEIYLCWKLGEKRIEFWHYLDTGFAGRQPLD